MVLITVNIILHIYINRDGLSETEYDAQVEGILSQGESRRSAAALWQFVSLLYSATSAEIWRALTLSLL